MRHWKWLRSMGRNGFNGIRRKAFEKSTRNGNKGRSWITAQRGSRFLLLISAGRCIRILDVTTQKAAREFAGLNDRMHLG